MSVKRIADGTFFGMESLEVGTVKKARLSYAPIERLPLDLLKKIFFEHVPLADLKSVSKVCKDYYVLVNNSKIKQITERYIARNPEKLARASKLSPVFLYEKLAYSQLRILGTIPFILANQYRNLRLRCNNIHKEEISNFSFIDMNKILTELPMLLTHAHFQSIFSNFKDVYLHQLMHFMQLLPNKSRRQCITLNELQKQVEDLQWSLVAEKGKDFHTQWSDIYSTLVTAWYKGMEYVKEICNEYGDEMKEECKLPFIDQTFERFTDSVKFINEGGSGSWLRETPSYKAALQDVRARCKDVASMLPSFQDEMQKNLNQANFYFTSLNLMQSVGNKIFKSDFVCLDLFNFYQHNKSTFFANKNLVIISQPHVMQKMGEKIQPVFTVWLNAKQKMHAIIAIKLIDNANTTVLEGFRYDSIEVKENEIFFTNLKLADTLNPQKSYRFVVRINSWVIASNHFHVQA